MESGIGQAKFRVKDPGPQHGVRHRRHNTRQVKDGPKDGNPTHLSVKQQCQRKAQYQTDRHRSQGVNRGHLERLPEQFVGPQFLKVGKAHHFGRRDQIPLMKSQPGRGARRDQEPK